MCSSIFQVVLITILLVHVNEFHARLNEIKNSWKFVWYIIVIQPFFSVYINLGSPCDSAPCLHGGTCTNKAETFECTCRPGYSGKQCEHGKNVKNAEIFWQCIAIVCPTKVC